MDGELGGVVGVLVVGGVRRRNAPKQKERGMSEGGTFKVGDKVETCVWVCNERRPVNVGYVVAMSFDGSISDVDVGSWCGCAPWIHKEVTAHLRKVEHD